MALLRRWSRRSWAGSWKSPVRSASSRRPDASRPTRPGHAAGISSKSPRKSQSAKDGGDAPEPPGGEGGCLVLQILRKWAMKGLDRRGRRWPRMPQGSRGGNGGGVRLDGRRRRGCRRGRGRRRRRSGGRGDGGRRGRRTAGDHTVARKRDPPGALSTGRDALPRVRRGIGPCRPAEPCKRQGVYLSAPLECQAKNVGAVRAKPGQGGESPPPPEPGTRK